MAKFDAFEQFRMTDHVAIVTGGAQNIGEGVARTFSGAGAKVMIADLNGDKAVVTAKKIFRRSSPLRFRTRSCSSAPRSWSPCFGSARSERFWCRPSPPLCWWRCSPLWSRWSWTFAPSVPCCGSREQRGLDPTDVPISV